MKTIAITTFKGGVGKTSTARDLATALARRRFKVLAVDLDRTQRHLATYFGNVPGVEVRASTAGRLARLVETATKNGFDFVVVDCPPALSKETGKALLQADTVIAPTQPEYLSADGLARLKQAVDAARLINRKLTMKVLITMLDARDPNCAPIEAAIRRNFNGQTFPESIRRQPAFSAAALLGASIVDNEPRSQGARVYRALADKIIKESEGA